MTNNLQIQLLDFAVRVLKFLIQLPKTPKYTTICYQLSKSSTSSVANYSPRQI